MAKAKSTNKKSKLPDVMSLDPKNQQASIKALKKIKKNVADKKDDAASPLNRRGIIMVNHLPFGFFEEEIRGFFGQFGKVLRVRVARSPKTGKPKGYAFVEFQYEGVAKIAAESMNNYLMFERLIKCHVLNSTELKNSTKIFKGKNISKSSYPTLHRRNKIKSDQEKPLTEEEIEKAKESRKRAIEKHNQKLKELGIDYQFEMNTEVEQIPKAKTRKRKVSDSGEPLVTPAKKRVSEDKPSKSPTRENLKKLKAIDESAVFGDINKAQHSSPKQKNMTPKKKASLSANGTPNKKSITPAITPKQEPITPKKKNSLKVERSPVVTENEEVPKLQKRKSLDKAKKSPKGTPSKKMQKSLEIASPEMKIEPQSPAKDESFEHVTINKSTASKKKRKSFEKFSPKLTRSKAAVVTPSPAPPVTSAIRKTKSMSAKDQVAEKKKRKTFEKFSPKLTRSKASNATGTPAATTLKPTKKNSRVSDVSELKAFPTKTKKLSRKSCI